MLGWVILLLLLVDNDIVILGGEGYMKRISRLNNDLLPSCVEDDGGCCSMCLLMLMMVDDGPDADGFYRLYPTVKRTCGWWDVNLVCPP